MSNLNQFSGGLLKFNKTQAVGFNNVSNQSAAFDSQTVAIYVSIKGDDRGGYIEIGSNPTATTTSFFVKGHQQASEINPDGLPFGPIGVEAGHKLAAVNVDSSNQTCYIMELKY